MECTLSPALTDEQINSLLDGTDDHDLLQHIEQCESCANRLHHARQIEMSIQQHLYRMECPNADELGDFYMNLLDEEHIEAIKTHLQLCSRCQKDLEILKQYMEQDELSIADQQKNKKLIVPPRDYFIAEFVNIPLEAVRGGRTQRGSSGRQIRARTEGVDLLIDIQKTIKGLDITGILIQDDAFDSWSSSLMQLRQDGEVVMMKPLDELSMFHCNNVEAGYYAIRITAEDGRIIEIPNIDISLEP